MSIYSVKMIALTEEEHEQHRSDDAGVSTEYLDTRNQSPNLASPLAEQRQHHCPFAVNAYRALRPGNVVDVDCQRFLTAKATIIDQPEQGTIAWVRYFPQDGFDLL